VGAVVEGSVMRSGERVRITAQLIEGATDRHLWAESYERDLTDVLALQSQVARAIAEQIKVKLTPQETTRLTSALPLDPVAHEAYLRGRYHWNRRTEEGLKKSIDFFNQAIERAPDYAPAHAGLADSYIILGNFGLFRPEDAYPRAKAAAMRALELDDSLAEAHTSLAFANYLFERDWPAAERGFRLAIELNPNYGVAHQWYGVSLASREQPEAAIAELKRAQEVDPLSLIIQAVVGWVYVLTHRYDQAIEQCRTALEIDPNFAPAHQYLGQALEQQRKYKEAIAEFEKANTLFGKAWDSSLGHAYAVAGRTRDAQKVLDEMMGRSEKEYVPSDAIALIYAGLGEKDRAFVWLNRAENERQPWLVLLKVDPRFDALRSDPRFKDLVRGVGLPAD
jgi:tetratricopeptide (TPR) repeat protein